jgi:hypothetical protein
VLPVADTAVDATLPHLPPIVADMVRVQRLTGARPGEICILRPADISETEAAREYRQLPEPEQEQPQSNTEDPADAIREAIRARESLPAEGTPSNQSVADDQTVNLPGWIGIRLDQERMTATRDGFPPLDLRRSPLRYAILARLFQAGDAICRRDTLTSCWRDQNPEEPDDDRVDSEISALRGDLTVLGLGTRYLHQKKSAGNLRIRPTASRMQRFCHNAFLRVSTADVPSSRP